MARGCLLAPSVASDPNQIDVAKLIALRCDPFDRYIRPSRKTGGPTFFAERRVFGANAANSPSFESGRRLSVQELHF